MIKMIQRCTCGFLLWIAAQAVAWFYGGKTAAAGASLVSGILIIMAIAIEGA